jgi:hypothetical protein
VPAFADAADDEFSWSSHWVGGGDGGSDCVDGAREAVSCGGVCFVEAGDMREGGRFGPKHMYGRLETFGGCGVGVRERWRGVQETFGVLDRREWPCLTRTWR